MDGQPATDGQKTRPGKNPKSGLPAGELKIGNTKNVGAKPAALREMMRSALGLKHIRDIANNRKCIHATEWRVEKQIIPKAKRKAGEEDAKWVKTQVPVKRRPTPTELLAANEFLARYGLGSKVELTGDDGSPLIPKPYRLEKLSNEQLDKLEELISVAGSDGDPSRTIQA